MRLAFRLNWHTDSSAGDFTCHSTRTCLHAGKLANELSREKNDSLCAPASSSSTQATPTPTAAALENLSIRQRAGLVGGEQEVLHAAVASSRQRNHTRAHKALPLTLVHPFAYSRSMITEIVYSELASVLESKEEGILASEIKVKWHAIVCAGGSAGESRQSWRPPPSLLESSLPPNAPAAARSPIAPERLAARAVIAGRPLAIRE